MSIMDNVGNNRTLSSSSSLVHYLSQMLRLGRLFNWRRTESEDVSPNDIVILVVGPSGCGKSTFINTVTRKDAVHVHHKLSKHANPVTPVRGSPSDGQKGQDVVFVDTPPLETQDDDAGVAITRWLDYAAGRGAKLAGIIYLYPITSPKMTEPPGPQYESFIKQHPRVHSAIRDIPTVLVTTMWEKQPPPEQVKQARHEEISANWRNRVKHGEIMQYNGSYLSSQEVVKKLNPVLSE
ncbi:unnamed protein product [Cyclocybe aegerita]|uniref:G domain-containing protein n=1 Tax=Cyclocybe aegerita TaxID=1973307 RepID=A0A8S0XFI5_CYCAE|nr:unnamed protein product [Cyclocybe aegerita]